MTIHTTFSPLPFFPHLSARLLPWLFAAFTTLTPLALIAYAYLASPESAERVRILLQGFEVMLLTFAGAAVALWLQTVRVRIDLLALTGNRSQVAAA